MHFIPGELLTRSGPLARYLPPIPEGVATIWLKENIPSGAWILDPFGSSPILINEIVRAGYRVLVNANNPVARFLIEMAVNPLREDDFNAALAEIASATKGDERIEPHIRSLYQTHCNQCEHEIDAHLFIWERGATSPLAKIYQCPNCGDNGERQVNQADVEKAVRFSRSGLHRARALERVAPLDDPDRAFVEEALETYPPRAVYVLFTLINKLDSLSTEHQRSLRALLLAAFDQANTLWSHPTQRTRPRQLTIPARFREHNIWLALEEAGEHWMQSSRQESGARSTNIKIWPETPSEAGGVSLFEGRLKDLAREAPGVEFQAVLTALPRPNQAFWTLSALWAGWLWGREAAAPFKSVLRRRRYDWGWHCTALQAAFANLTSLLKPEIPIFALMAEAEAGFLAATLLAANLAGLELTGLTLRARSEQAQIAWQKFSPRSSPQAEQGDRLQSGVISPIVIRDLAQKSFRNYLMQNGEPASYINLYAVLLTEIVSDPFLLQDQSSNPAEILSIVHNAVQPVFASAGGLLHYGASEHSPELGHWWLNGSYRQLCELGVQTALSDQVEVSIVQYLLKNPRVSLSEVDQAMCQGYPDQRTPERELIQTCLGSYGEKEPSEVDVWKLRQADTPKNRRSDLAKITSLLEQIGQRLEYDVSGPEVPDRPGRFPLLWLEANGQVSYAFYIIASAVIGKLVCSNTLPPERMIIVYPGGRAGLLLYKLHNNPYLQKEINLGWRWIKFRHLYRLVEENRLTRHNLDEQFNRDPMTGVDTQMTLL